MRFIAEYALKSRTNAVIATALSAAVPFFFWLAAAVVGLVTLRKGSRDGSQVMLFGSLPAIYWLSQGDPTAAFVMIGSFMMALVLRQTVSWASALLLGAALGSITASTVQWLPPDVMLEIARMSRELITGSTELAESAGVELDQFLTGLFSGMISAVHVLMMIASLMLARSWQASLFNPGGFRQEFHQLRLPVSSGLVLGGLIIFGAGISPEVIKWIPSLTLPLAFACIALVHAIVAIKQMSNAWLIAFYVVLFFTGNSLYVLMIFVALLDSSLDFRKRMMRSGDSGGS